MTRPVAAAGRARLCAAIRWTLVQAGFSHGDAEAWARGWASGPELTRVLSEATMFDDHHLPVAEAVEWHQAGFTAHEVEFMRDVGWTAAEAAGVRDSVDGDDVFVEWACLGLPGPRVLAYIRADVSCGEVAAFEANPMAVDAVLSMLGALLTA